jgi:hypothetical protein
MSILKKLYFMNAYQYYNILNIDLERICKYKNKIF